MSQNVDYKCLPCKTHIMCGTCPYANRCQYIHDQRVFMTLSKSTSRRKNIENNLSDDAWFWPKINNDNLEYIEYYNIQQPHYYNDISIAELSLYSIWNHFISFLSNNYSDSRLIINPFTRRRRLRIFIQLSNIKSEI